MFCANIKYWDEKSIVVCTYCCTSVLPAGTVLNSYSGILMLSYLCIFRQHDTQATRGYVLSSSYVATCDSQYCALRIHTSGTNFARPI